MTDEQLDTYTEPLALKMVCDNIKPQVTPQKAKFRKRKAIPMRKGGTPATLKVTSVISVERAVHCQRCSYDESQMRGELMKRRIQYESVQSIQFDRCNKPDSQSRLTTEITVNYLK
jgi:hypothetical protein